MLMIADKLPELVKTQVEAIKNLKIDKITVWDTMGSGKDGKSPATANFLSECWDQFLPLRNSSKWQVLNFPIT